MKVKLTWIELTIAAVVGIARRITSIQGRWNKFKHCEKSDWATDIDGAAAEMAVAKALGLYWDCSNRSFKRADLAGALLHVRSTNHPDGHLIVRKNDENGLYVLVITDSPHYRIVGWISLDGAKEDRFWQGDSWWVPQGELNSISCLQKRYRSVYTRNTNRR